MIDIAIDAWSPLLDRSVYISIHLRVLLCELVIAACVKATFFFTMESILQICTFYYTKPHQKLINYLLFSLF
jgi:hypothetical protein